MDQQHHFRALKAQGIEAKLPVFYNNDPQEASCRKCGTIFNKYTSKCKSCHTKHWCKWDTSFYRNPFASASSGTNAFVKSLGNYFAIVASSIYLYGLINAFIFGVLDNKTTEFFIFGVAYLYATYEIWAFTHGKITRVRYIGIEPDLENTNIRVFSLMLDFLVLSSFGYEIIVLTY
jgi:hypothetical protein